MALSKEQDPSESEEGTSSEKEGPEYSFEGFTIEFSEKVMLTPLGQIRTPKKKGLMVL